MSLEIYDNGFTNRHEITQAISVQTSDYYNDVGKIVLNVPIDNYNISVLKPGAMIYNTETGFSYWIVNTKTDTAENRLTANGYTANWILNSRIISASTEISAVESGVYSLISDNLRGLSYIVLADEKPLSATTNVILEGEQLLDKVKEVLASADYGHKMVWNDAIKKFTFEIYEGRNLTQGIHAVVFSEEQGTAQELVINDDISTFKNVGYCKSKYSNGTEFTVVVGTALGDDRREKWITSGGVSQENGESATNYLARVEEYVANELKNYIRSKSFTVEIDGSEFDTIYKLGDIVACSSVRFGVQFNARITGIKYTMDAKGQRTNIVLGDPILTMIGELKLNG